MYLMTSTRRGVAAKELERQIGCTYKTAWRMAHELRKLMASADYQGPLSGHVEVDETFVGGKKRRIPRQKNRKPGRTPGRHAIVFGMVERNGAIRAGTIPDVKQTTVEPIILTNVQRGSTISTDELRSYADLGRSPYRHGTVDHSQEEWVKGIHHTNTIEGH